MMEFTVRVDMGDVYVDGKFVRQLCWDAESIGYAVTAYLNDDCDETDGSEGPSEFI